MIFFFIQSPHIHPHMDINLQKTSQVVFLFSLISNEKNTKCIKMLCTVLPLFFAPSFLFPCFGAYVLEISLLFFFLPSKSTQTHSPGRRGGDHGNMAPCSSVRLNPCKEFVTKKTKLNLYNQPIIVASF